MGPLQRTRGIGTMRPTARYVIPRINSRTGLWLRDMHLDDLGKDYLR